MTNAEIAKNILLNRTCHNCGNRGWDEGIICKCAGVSWSIPGENTCMKWVREIEIAMQSFPFVAKARKLSVRWTKDENC